MIQGKRIVVVMPAYNAEKTLRQTVAEIPRPLVDEVILVDDASRDQTVRVAKQLRLRTLVHPQNRGYGGNQKTCYTEALRLGADIVIMVHPDYQYTPKLIPAMAHMLVDGLYDVALASRILGGQARTGGMPLYKYVSNRFLTTAQNLLHGAKLSEYHTGYRAFTRQVLETIRWQDNSDDFVFDNQMLAQVLYHDFRVAEITCPTKYFGEASSINFQRSVVYGLGCLAMGLRFRLAKWGLRPDPLLSGTSGWTVSSPFAKRSAAKRKG